jgi:glutamine amidotransferase
MIGIIEYGMGNLRSVFHALESLGAEARLLRRAEELRGAERLVLPGVGAFRDCMHNLTSRGFADALHEEVRGRGKPILGICLGLQAMARRSFEGGEYAGLGWFEADVVRLQPTEARLRIPHIGWNSVHLHTTNSLFADVPDEADFYFVHSYHMQCDLPADVMATTEYGQTVTAAVRKGNIFATQFHPEKSQDHGLRLLENFLRWRP